MSEQSVTPELPPRMAEPSTTQQASPRISVSSTSTLANRTGSWKYIRPRYQDGVAPCNARCPTGVDVEGYMNLLREGRVADALDLVLRENPMPAITGRVCHHPCELACNRAQYDDPVAVHLVEREMGDRVLSMPPPVLRRTRAEKVATRNANMAQSIANADATCTQSSVTPSSTDDPMARPAVKYPTNHHLSQILERWTVNGAYVTRAWSVEAGVFGGGTRLGR